MFIRKEFKEITLDRERFDLKNSIINITHVEEPLSMTLVLITKYENGKVITVRENILIEKNYRLYPLTHFKKLFLYHDKYGYPKEYELLFKTNRKKYFDKTKIKFMESE